MRIIILFLVLVLSGCCCKNYDSQILLLNIAVSRMNNSINNIRQENDYLGGEVKTIKSNLNNYGGQRIDELSIQTGDDAEKKTISKINEIVGRLNKKK